MNKILAYTLLIVAGIATGCSSNPAPSEKAPDQSVEIVVDQRIEEPIKEELIEEKPIEEAVEEPKEKIKEEQKEETKKESTEKSTEEVKEVPIKQSEQEVSSFSNDRKSWWFKRNSDNLPPGAQGEIDIAKYDAYYLGNTNEKNIYLTFDEGYENGYTAKILDVLKEHHVKAGFFVTKPYIESQPDLVKRMVAEGHIVGNHSVTHPSLPSKNREEIEYEIKETARYFEEVTGSSMPLFFRPPAGEYSERTLQITKDLGYKTIFWSMAYKDWEVDNQPGKQAAYQHIVDNHHQGALILLHAVSSSNTEALGEIIQYLKEQGYTFASLDEL